MTYMNKQGYLERKKGGCKKNYWIIKHKTIGPIGYVPIERISFKGKHIGKKVRFKVEIIEE